MLKFSTLLIRMDQVADSSNKMKLLKHYLQTADDSDFYHTIKLFTQGFSGKSVSKERLYRYAQEFSGLPEWLIHESVSVAGDDIEGLSLLLPHSHSEERELPLTDVLKQIRTIKSLDMPLLKEQLFALWKKLHPDCRYITNKLLTGRFRSPLPVFQLALVLSDLTTFSPLWHLVMLLENADDNRFHKSHIFTSPPSPELWKVYPFPVTKSFHGDHADKTRTSEFFYRPLYDGIRCHLIKRQDKIRIWSEHGELLNDKSGLDFSALSMWSFNGVLEANLKDGYSNPIMITDVLESDGNDISQQTRIHKNAVLSTISRSKFPDKSVQFSEWKRIPESEIHMSGLIEKGAIGLFAEHQTCSNQSFVVKPQRHKIKTVLLYAQKENQQSYILTVGLSDGFQWFPVAKVTDGLSDSELTELDQYIRKNTIEKFGPVRTVKPEIVFEISYERVSFSKRHKSGLILHSPKLERWLKFLQITEALPLQSLK